MPDRHCNRASAASGKSACGIRTINHRNGASRRVGDGIAPAHRLDRQVDRFSDSRRALLNSTRAISAPEFIISKPIASARLYATALGLYEFEINGNAVSDAVFLPGRTEYAKRVPYHVFDIAPLLREGPTPAAQFWAMGGTAP